jgi:hypothetical protein
MADTARQRRNRIVLAQTTAPAAIPPAAGGPTPPPAVAARNKAIPNPRVQGGETEIERRARERDSQMSRRICRGC